MGDNPIAVNNNNNNNNNNNDDDDDDNKNNNNIRTLIMETKSVSEMCKYMNHQTWLSLSRFYWIQRTITIITLTTTRHNQTTCFL